MRPTSIDVIVPTYNRAALLSETLRSIRAAKQVPGLGIRVIVVNNNSTDDTDSIVTAEKALFGPALCYISETRQGKSYALNSALSLATAELVGFVDDDERVDVSWFEEVARQFSRNDIDYLGGPYHPIWSNPPAWLPQTYFGAVGAMASIPQLEMPYDEHFRGMLMGGNAVIRRELFDSVGLYDTSSAINRAKGQLRSGGDSDMYRRLLASGARGRFSPNLIVYHAIPDSRLTLRYLWRWALAHGTSNNYQLHHRRGLSQTPLLFGVPRWRFSKAVADIPTVLRGLLLWRDQKSVEALLNWAELFGHIRGRVLY
jgi:glycosyltransferase involved in cell wall biosynthesis